MDINVQKLNTAALLPEFAHGSDAGADLFAAEEVTVYAGERTFVPTGIALAIPDGYVGLVWPKSGLAAKSGIMVMGGVIDAGYRGEINVIVYNAGNEEHTFHAGEKVAQILFQKVEHATFTEVTELDETARGEGGFGSTGK